MKKTLFVISDQHLGGAPASNGKPSFEMCPPAGQARLADFFKYVKDSKTPSREIHLVINGDLVDFLAEEEFLPFTNSDDVARQKLARIMDRTEVVWSKLQEAVQAGVRLTVLLGNHDIELSL